MEIEIKDYGEVLRILSNIEGDGIYSITVDFLNGDCLAYAYDNKKRFTTDSRELNNKLRKYRTNGRT